MTDDTPNPRAYVAARLAETMDVLLQGQDSRKVDQLLYNDTAILTALLYLLQERTAP